MWYYYSMKLGNKTTAVLIYVVIGAIIANEGIVHGSLYIFDIVAGYFFYKVLTARE
jgi:hypothetical protein